VRHAVYSARDDHSFGLTIEECRARLQRIDEELPGLIDPAKIERLEESRAWFERQLDKLQNRRMHVREHSSYSDTESSNGRSELAGGEERSGPGAP
jgi:hypothetical protein